MPLSTWLRRLLFPDRALLPLDHLAPPDERVERDRPAVELVAAPAPASPDRLRRTLIAAFDSTHPVASPQDLFGRDVEMRDLLGTMLEEGQHALVHGARGSGKTSIVRIFGDHADEYGAVVVYLACEPDATFAQTLRPFLHYVPPEVLDDIDPLEYFRRIAALPADFSPRALVELLAHVRHRRVIFILDEFDRIENPRVIGAIASFMKLLSDAMSRVQLMLVGIAHSVDEVIAGHASLRRHMHVVSLRCIDTNSVDALIEHGASSAGVRFSPEARAVIARIACGSPFHVRLLARRCGLAAVETSADVVEERHAVAGARAAFAEWAKTNYRDAALFRELAAEPGAHASLEAIARMAANEDLLRESDLSSLGLPSHASARLAEAMDSGGRDAGELLFRDTTAPQFLIALLVSTAYEVG